MSIRVLLADDHELIREGLKSRLNLEPDINVVAEATQGEEALRLLKSATVDVALLDVNMPKLNGLEVLSRLRAEQARKDQVRVIFLSVHDEREYIERAVKLGAAGYILKDTRMQDLVDGVRRCHAGENYFSTRAALQLVDWAQNQQERLSRRQENAKAFGLSARELEILELVSAGRTNKEVANALGLSVRTAETHRQNIREKLGAKNSAELIRIAIEQELVPFQSS